MTDSGTPTIVHQFADRLQRDAARAALHIKRGNHFASISWAELGHDVHRIALGLTRLGTQPGDRVAQLSENRYEWIVTDLAIQLVQAVHVPLHASLAAEQIQRQVEHSESRVLFLSDDTQLVKLDRIEAQLPGDLPLIRYHGRRRTLGPRPVIDWSSWSKSGDAASLSTMIRRRRPRWSPIRWPRFSIRRALRETRRESCSVTATSRSPRWARSKLKG